MEKCSGLKSATPADDAPLWSCPVSLKQYVYKGLMEAANEISILYETSKRLKDLTGKPIHGLPWQSTLLEMTYKKLCSSLADEWSQMYNGSSKTIVDYQYFKAIGEKVGSKPTLKKIYSEFKHEALV